jgi:hypothetical protein
MKRMIVQTCLAAMALAGAASGAEAARYIKVAFETNPVPYYRAVNPPAPPFVEQYQKVLTGELLFDTAAANASHQLSFGGDATQPRTFVQYTASSLYLFQDGTGEDRGITASFTPVNLSAAPFTATLTMGSFSAYFPQQSNLGFPALTGGSLATLTVTGFDSEEMLAPYLRWSEASASPAPEPASWAMMLGGFGLIGAALRNARRPRRVVQQLV